MSPDGSEDLPALVFNTLRAAPKAETLQALSDLFCPTCQILGFDYLAVVEASSVPKSRGLTLLFGRADEAWHDTYQREGLASVDPRMRHMLASAEPILLSELVLGREGSEQRSLLGSAG